MLADILSRYGIKSKLVSLRYYELLFSEYGGRLLAIIEKNTGNNLLWVHPNISEIIEKKEWNIGGLRLWVSPEQRFFYKDPDAFDGWFCPSGLDPDSYKMLVENNIIVMKAAISVRDMKTNEFFNASAERRFETITDDKVLHIRLRERLIGNKISTPVDAWDLIQVAPGASGFGNVIIPASKGAKPINYFSEIPSEYLRVEDEYVVFKIDGRNELKLGIAPEDLDNPKEAKIGYIFNPSDNLWAFIGMISHSAPESQRECIDPPKFKEAKRRGSVQSYNSGPSLGLVFGEIELHSKPGILRDKKYVIENDIELFFYSHTESEKVLEFTGKLFGLRSKVRLMEQP